ncbi:MAG: hypothetical protein Q7S27_07045 [Nanoarchaeota archaeon]|nr:hypothetical protein [Nanoarchaeota archaeon]
MTLKKLKHLIEQTVEEEIREGGFSGTYTIRQHDRYPRFDGCIDTQTLSDISLGYNPTYEEDNPGNTAKVVRDLTRHEENHRGRKGYHGCPRNLEFHVKKIIEPISSVLAEKGFSQADFHYSANAFEDTVLHLDLSHGFSLDGIIDAYVDSGKSSKFTQFMEAHLRLNALLWGNKRQKAKLRLYFTDKVEDRSKIIDVLKNFLSKTGLSKMKKERDRKGMRDYLNNEENWPSVAKIYAEEFSKLMAPGYAMPLFNHSGKGTNRNLVPQVPEDGNKFDREMNTREYKKQRINEAYKSNQKTPAWMNSFEALDLLYQSLAERLNINVSSFTRQSQSPVFHYGSRPFDPEIDNLRHTKLGFNEIGKVELKKKPHYETEPLEEKILPRGFPEFRFLLLDTSGSMASNPDNGIEVGNKLNIPWGDNSKYHYQLLAWYGLLRYLKENNLLKQTGISLGAFASSTIVKHGLEESKKLALNPTFGNSTNIDLDSIKNIFKDQNMLLGTISDGIIDNWSDIKEDFLKGAKRHNYFHIQIGNPTEMSNDVEKAGLFVGKIKNARDIAQTAVNITDSIYRGGIK